MKNKPDQRCVLHGCNEKCPIDDIPYCCIQHMSKDIDHNEPPEKYGKYAQQK